MSNRAARLLDLSPGLEQKIKVGNSTCAERFGVRLRGKSETFTCYCSVQSDPMEPIKGGIRHALSVSQDEVMALAALMTDTCALVETPVGRSKGGLWNDPRQWEEGELEQITRRLACQLVKRDLIHPAQNVPAPDVWTAYHSRREVRLSRQDAEDLRVAACIVSIGRVVQTCRSKGL